MGRLKGENLSFPESALTLSKLMEELVAAKILTPKRDGSEVYCLDDDLISILAG